MERLQVELEDLEKDHERVKAQLRVELDAPTQSKLERQIKQIGQQMDTTEQQLFELNQPDD